MQLHYELDKAEIGKRLRKVRRRNNMTQEKMAEALGVSSRYLSKIENGKNSPSLMFVMKFSEITGASLDYLMKDRAEPGGAEDMAPLLSSVYEDLTDGDRLSPKEKTICDAVTRSLIETLRKNDV